MFILRDVLASDNTNVLIDGFETFHEAFSAYTSAGWEMDDSELLAAVGIIFDDSTGRVVATASYEAVADSAPILRWVVDDSAGVSIWRFRKQTIANGSYTVQPIGSAPTVTQLF